MMAKRVAAMCLLALLSLIALMPTTSVAHASAEVEALVEPPSVTVHMAFRNVNASLYELMRSHPEAFNEATVPEAITTYMLANGYAHVNYTDAHISFDDATRTVELSFRLSGEDLLSFHYNRTNMARVYELNMVWRKADVVVRSGAKELFRLNFSSYFSAPLEKWEQTDHALPGGEICPALRLESNTTDRLDPIFILVLPKGARVVRAKGDMLTFELPPRASDLFMATPFWPLMAVIAITCLAALSRGAAVRWVRPREERRVVPSSRRSPQPLSRPEEGRGR